MPEIKVYKFGPAFGLPDLSPFVSKVETYLRISGQKYEAVTGDVRKAPRKQLPFVDVDGKIIPDSTHIIDHLEGLKKEKLDAHLDAKQRAVALAFKSMLEEHLYFAILHMRWAEDDGWAALNPNLRKMLGKSGVPSLFIGMIMKSIRKQVRGRAATQGIGRMERADIVTAGKRLVDSLSDHMGDSKYFAGDKPSTFDATAYAFISNLLCTAFDNEIHQHTMTKKNLIAYADRMKAEYWKDEAS